MELTKLREQVAQLTEELTQTKLTNESLTGELETYKTKYHETLEANGKLFAKLTVGEKEDETQTEEEEIVTIHDQDLLKKIGVV